MAFGFMMRAAAVAATVVCASVSQAATLYDLKTDWSDSSNPNGAWRYREGVNNLPAVASWQSSLGGFSSAQPGWADSENGSDRLPFIFKYQGNATFPLDMLVGDIGMHTTDDVNGVGNGNGNVAWVSPGEGVIDVSGAVWQARDDLGRSNDWFVYLNNTLLTSGSLSSADPYSRATPFDLATGSGGAGALQDLAVQAGDVLRLEFVRTHPSGDFVGMDLSVSFEAIPEPTSLGLLGLGGLAMLRRRR